MEIFIMAVGRKQEDEEDDTIHPPGKYLQGMGWIGRY